MDETRDAELGRQLEALAEPDHGPEYWRDVRLGVAGASADLRRPSLGRRLRALLAPRRVRLALAAAALVAVTAAALLAGLPRTPGPESVGADEVLSRALDAYSSGHTWQADVAVKYFASDMWEIPSRYDVVRLHLIEDADGSYRVTEYEGAAGSRRVAGVEAYDATTRTLRDDWRRSWRVVTNCPLGPPDDSHSSLIGVDFGATYRALAATGKLRLDETVVDGRPAWTVTCTKGEMAGLPPSTVDWPVYTVSVDKQTWLPLRFQEVRAGVLGYDCPIPQRAHRRAASQARVHAAAVAGDDRKTLRPGVQARLAGRRSSHPGDHAARAGLRSGRLQAVARGQSRLARSPTTTSSMPGMYSSCSTRPASMR